MATSEFYCRSWFFIQGEHESSNPSAYPVGNPMAIGRQANSDRFMMAWTDQDDDLHVIVDLQLEHGRLANTRAKDLSTGIYWDIHIEPGEVLGMITARVHPAEHYPDNNLTGTWGAEDQPPPEGEPVGVRRHGTAESQTSSLA